VQIIIFVSYSLTHFLSLYLQFRAAPVGEILQSKTYIAMENPGKISGESVLFK